MGWIDIVGGRELDAYGAKVSRPRYVDEADAEYRARLRQAPSPADTRDYGGSAFPEPGSAQCGGMSLRDYFAAKAMQGIISTVPHLSAIDPRDAAEEAYSYANAMLAERAK
jgi:hypothetical protein